MFGKIYETTWWGNPTPDGWGNIYYDLQESLSVVTLRYEDRIIADGGTVESLDCVNALFTEDYNWNYYFRVTDDGGVVESLECVTI